MDFETYESDFQLALQEAKAKLAQINGTSGDERRELLRAIESATDEGIEVLEQMAIVVQGLPSSQRSGYNTTIRQCRSQIDEAKDKLGQLLDSQDRHELMGGRDEQRQQLLQNNSSLERSSQRLRESQRIALETENVGGGILNDLRAQREQIVGARSTLQAADGYVDTSVRTLRSMSRRLTANKMISYGIIAVLILLIFLVLASKFW